jgi:hypothetical protein
MRSNARYLLPILFLVFMAISARVSFASSVTCYAVASGTWNSASVWANTAGGGGGTCSNAPGGAGYVVEGNTSTLPAGVPGVAGNGEIVVINSGVTVHVPAGVGVQVAVGNSSLSGFTINAVSSSAYGAIVVDAHAKLVTTAAWLTGTTHPGTISQYAVLQVAPGGHLDVIGSGNGADAMSVSGRLYVGCGDQTRYPTPFCAGNAGGWVIASASSTLNITATSTTSLPTGLAVGDMVELDRIPQRIGTYPYATLDGITPPPPIPTMPTSNDSGTAANNVCGTAANCLIPESTQLCVVAISGNSISVGWPRGGTPADPYCTGAETAAGITDPGSGLLWLKKPAYFWGPTSNFAWNHATTTYTLSSNPSMHYDGMRNQVPFGLNATFTSAVSNMAHTGPGRRGDADLTINSGNFGSGLPALGSTACSLLSVGAVTTSGCYIDYDQGVGYMAGGTSTNVTTNISFVGWTLPSAATLGSQEILIPAGTRAYNEMIFENADVRYVGSNSAPSTPGIITFSPVGSATNASNNHLAFQYNTVRYAWNVVGLKGVSPDASVPIEITDNSSFPVGTGGFGAVQPYSSSANIDVSHNYAKVQGGTFLNCVIVGNPTTTMNTISGLTLTNNYVLGTLFADDGSCSFPGMLIQQNRITGPVAQTMPVNSNYWAAIEEPYSLNVALPVLIRNNYAYAVYRWASLGRNVEMYHNFVSFIFHHNVIMSMVGYTPAASLSNNVANVKVHDNIFLSYPYAPVAAACVELGYNYYGFIDGPQVYRNDCLGYGVKGSIYLDETDDSAVSLVAGGQIYDNILAQNGGSGTAPTLNKTSNINSATMQQSQLTYIGHNSAQGATTMYGNVGGANSNHISNPEYYHDVLATDANGNYNTDGARKITGVAIQNPTYSANKTGTALKLTVTSASDTTMAWSLDGTNWTATPVELNWPAAGYTFTVSSTADPGSIYDFLTVTAAQTTPAPSSTPFGAWAYPVPTMCPSTRWARIIVASGTVPVGTTFAIIQCPATNQLTFVPRDTRLTSGDVFVILPSEIRLLDASSTDHIDVGIDARLLPSAVGTYTDTGINLTLTDFCASGCGGTPVVSGLPTTMNTGSNLPISQVAIPELGGSAEDAFNRGYYESSGTAWKTAGSTGGYIGAVPPKKIYQQPAGMGGWPTVF